MADDLLPCLRVLAALKPGDSLPEWLDLDGYTISALCGRAADRIEKLEKMVCPECV